MKFNRLSLLVLASLGITLSLAVCAEAQTVTQFDLNGQTGYEPYTTVTQATDGNFYGTTGFGGPKYDGNIFRVTPAGVITNIHYFCQQPNCADGWGASWPPILASDGNLYGVTSGETVDGVTYGQTLYKLTVDGEFTNLFPICGSECSYPLGITLASDGNFYGVSGGGGVSNNGTIFRVSLTGQYTVLHSFCSLPNCTDGNYVLYPPIQGNDGNFYGTAEVGGSNGTGVVYKLTPSGTYTVIHNFCAFENDDCPEGSLPAARLVQDGQGNFWGATQSGGSGFNGVVFKITPDGNYSVIYDFSYSSANIGWSSAALTLASDGNFYGVLGGGPSGSWDTNVSGGVYRITPEGVYTLLHKFHLGAGGGFNPLAPVIQATDGNFYGTDAFGGIPAGYLTPDDGYGTAFQLTAGLSPLVETVPVAGPVGQSVVILGNNLTGSTSVTFNGVAAEFTVESDTYIKATVPAGAATGMVSVVTPSATLNGNPQFVVSK
jgi:uncharacterized repeat protein (TIGR03803 family)